MAELQPGFPPDQREAVARLYWQAFGEKLGPVLGPEDRAVLLFRHIIDPNFALCVCAGGRVIGVAGFKTAKGAFTAGSLGDMCTIYGRFGGLWRGVLLDLLERSVALDVLLMDGICVDAKVRGQGLGTALLDGIKDEARARGCTSVRLDVIDSNPRARALFERHGFTARGTRSYGPLRHIFGFSRATTMTCAV